MDRPPPRTLLEQLVRRSCQTVEESCIAFEEAARKLGERAALSPRHLSRWMAGEVSSARPVMQRVAAVHWGYAFTLLIGPPLTEAELANESQAVNEARSVATLDGAPPLPLLQRIELLRQGLHDAIGTGGLSEAGLEEWEQTVYNHGQATRYRPARTMLAELTSDFTELQRLLSHRQAASALRRLTRITAQMSGLMFLTLIKLNEPLAARNWARTARIAADESGDNSIQSWVRAHEAYVHYYAGNLPEAVTVARHAQVLAGKTDCVGVPLAAALEARAVAMLGRSREVEPALDRAKLALARLDVESLAPSAFGYNEAQLYFHEGNAHTHLGNTKRALAAHESALSLYPYSDFLDRALVRLDTAACFAKEGDGPQAMAVANDALQQLSVEQRQGLIILRGHEVLQSLTRQQRALPIACDFQDLLVDHEESHC